MRIVTNHPKLGMLQEALGTSTMPPHRGLKAIAQVLYSNHSEPDPLQKSQTHFLQQTSPY